jgi:hypothetical protein
MRRRWVERLKPAAPARRHLLLAAAMWTVVGFVLAAVGTVWTVRAPHPLSPWLLPIAAALGLVKARWILDAAGRRIVERIEARGDGRCLGGFLSLRSWALVAVMIIGGRLLRAGGVDLHLVGLLYVVVGTGLLLASRIPWQAWWSRGASDSPLG